MKEHLTIFYIEEYLQMTEKKRTHCSVQNNKRNLLGSNKRNCRKIFTFKASKNKDSM